MTHRRDAAILLDDLSRSIREGREIPFEFVRAILRDEGLGGARLMQSFGVACNGMCARSSTGQKRRWSRSAAATASRLSGCSSR